LDQLWTQLIFVVTHFVFVTVAAGLLFLAIKATIGLRVSPEEEMAGLDVEEHGSPGYGHDPAMSVGGAIGSSGGAGAAREAVPSAGEGTAE
jgi:Amt family ammonium transporter